VTPAENIVVENAKALSGQLDSMIKQVGPPGGQSSDFCEFLLRWSESLEAAATVSQPVASRS